MGIIEAELAEALGMELKPRANRRNIFATARRVTRRASETLVFSRAAKTAWLTVIQTLIAKTVVFSRAGKTDWLDSFLTENISYGEGDSRKFPK